tara:strand:+ start:1967 stop:2164 length:198 start_codon:yes stop_codon:yes gene_type:complete
VIEWIALIITVIIAFGVVIWQQDRQLKEGRHPYLSIERISKLKTKEERKNERKRKRKKVTEKKDT